MLKHGWLVTLQLYRAQQHGNSWISLRRNDNDTALLEQGYGQDELQMSLPINSVNKPTQMDLNGQPTNIHLTRPSAVSLSVRLKFFKSGNTYHQTYLNQTTIKHNVQFLHTHSVVTILATSLHQGKWTIFLTTEGLALSVLKSPLKIIPSLFPVLSHFFPLVIPRLVSVHEPQKSLLTKYKHFLCKPFSSINAQDDAHITKGQHQPDTLLTIW